MRSWKRRTRARYKREVYIWKNSNARNYWPLIKLIIKKNSRKYRDTQKLMHYAKLKFQESMYIVDCRYHPSKVDVLDLETYTNGKPYNYDISCTSLVTNQGGYGCSYLNCGVEHISEAEAQERAEVIKTLGMLPYMLHYYFETNPTVERVTKYISGDKRMQREWGFNRNGNTVDITDEGREWIMATYGIDYDAVPEMNDEDYMRG